MNAQFTKDQQAAIRTLLSMFHPDKCPENLKEYADGFTKAVNVAKDKGTYSVIAQIMALIAKYGITKDTKDGLAEAWAEFSSQPKTEGPRSGPKAEPKPEPKVDPTIMAKAKAKLADTNWDRKRMNSWLGAEFAIYGKLAKAYLDELFQTTKTEGRESNRADFYKRLETGPMTDAEFAKWLKAQSDNVQKHASAWDMARKMANAIWAKK